MTANFDNPTPYDSVPFLPKGKFCKQKETGEIFICARKQLHPGVVFIGGQKKAYNGSGQIVDKVGKVWPVSREEFDQKFEIQE